jgi:integrase
MLIRTRKLFEQWLELLSDTKPEAWLFPSENGRTPISYSNVYRRNIRPALAKVGLGNINFLILRRTWVNEFSKAEKDPTIPAQLAGHSVDVDENEYCQPQTEVLKRAMRRFEKRLQ